MIQFCGQLSEFHKYPAFLYLLPLNYASDIRCMLFVGALTLFNDYISLNGLEKIKEMLVHPLKQRF